jgi:hypothetical protein
MLLPSFSFMELHVIMQIVREWVNKQAYSTKVVDWSGTDGQKSITLTTLSTESEMGGESVIPNALTWMRQEME